MIEFEKMPEIKQALSAIQNHSVALLGYDDTLYGDKGALIVKNTWDTDSYRVLMKEKLTSEEEVIFNQFRGKISSNNNLPGYYAIPYQLILEKISMDDQGLTTNLTAIYAHAPPNYKNFYDQYKKHEPQFRVYYLPYTCDKNLARELLNYYSVLSQAANSNSGALTAEAISNLSNLLDGHVFFTKASYFNIAKVSQDLDVFKFYGNEQSFRSFYCQNGEIYPTLDQIENIPFFRRILEHDSNYKSRTYWDAFFQDLGRKEGMNMTPLGFLE